MERSNFWNDAAKYGTILGAAAIVVAILRMYTQSSLLSWVWFVVYVLMMYFFTRRRSRVYADPEFEFGYGSRLGYMVSMMLFAGILEGVFMALAANWLFVELYDEAMSQSVALLEGTGFYSAEMVSMYVRWMHSPIILIFASIFGAAFKGAFFGLIISAFIKPEKPLFEAENNEENE